MIYSNVFQFFFRGISCRNQTKYWVKMTFLNSLVLVPKFVSFSKSVYKFGNSNFQFSMRFSQFWTFWIFFILTLTTVMTLTSDLGSTKISYAPLSIISAVSQCFKSVWVWFQRSRRNDRHTHAQTQTGLCYNHVDWLRI